VNYCSCWRIGILVVVAPKSMDGVNLVFRASMSTKFFERPKAHDGSRASDHRAILDN
jgi:hypothetical protein